jgi:hypothetical protein
MKRGLIKCNVLKFYDNYHVVHALNEMVVLVKMFFLKNMRIVQVQAPKKTFFMFIHCWMLFKNTSY